MVRKSLWLVSVLAAGSAVGGSLLLVGDAAAVPAPSKWSVVSRAILGVPLDIAVPERSEVEMAQLTIEPGGTTGVRKYPGPAIVSVVGGTASRSQIGGGSCRSTTVAPGVAYVAPAGATEEIRNDGAVPLQLQMTSLAPEGERSPAAASPQPGCSRTTADGLSVTVLTRTTIALPGRIMTNGPSDILVGRVVIPPGGTAGGWHTHPAAMLMSIEDGRFDVMAAIEGRCVQTHYPEGTGLVEPVGEIHDGRNDGAAPVTLYLVGISSFAGPFAVPQPPSACNTRQ